MNTHNSLPLQSLTRRRFLQHATMAGCAAGLHGLLPDASAKAAVSRPSLISNVRGSASHSPICVITGSVGTDINPRGKTWGYIIEILQRAGLFFDTESPSHLDKLFHRTNCMLVLAGNLPLTTRQRQAIGAWVNGGGSLIGIGGTSGLDEVFGVTSASPLAEGWLKVAAKDHPITSGLRSSLHVFGGYSVKAGSASSLATIETGTNVSRGSAIVENRFGKGRAVLLGPDLMFSIVHIQQGVKVLQDSKPAPDGSALVNEGVLKAEDGLVLDWQRDRSPMQPDNGMVFLEPVADELREIILRSIFHLAQQQEIALPMLWYWPGSAKAVGMISHDTDGNEPAKGVALLETMTRCNIKSTWCTLYPGGYPTDFYGKLKDQGFEIALHYDAMTGGEKTSWSKANFLFQHAWLVKTAGLRHITTNKNHYTRWEGRLDFWRWCEEAGIKADQTRGPSKKGTIGFPLGGSQPYFPIDDEAETPRFLNVLEVNLLTQDLIVTCPPEYGRQLVDSALRHHGVAHCLFHPAHILKPGVADALSGLVEYWRGKQLQWWTSRQIYEWEMLRRGVEAKFNAPQAFTLRATKPVRQTTLLVLRGASDRRIAVDGAAASTSRWNVYGFDFDAVTTSIEGEINVRVG